MPHPDLVWLVNLKGDPVQMDVYDIETWRELGWSSWGSTARNRMLRRRGGSKGLDAYLPVLEAYLGVQLDRGRRFHRSLSGPAGTGEPRPYVFGGDCVPTVARLVLAREGAGYRGYERVVV